MFNWTIILGFLVGLVIFIHGVESFSHEILKAAGERFRRFLKKATRNRFLSAFSGMLVTASIQSSTATTVITISLVSAGVISFAQSLGIIVGANIGTTVTAQLVAFNATAYAPIFIIIGFFLSLLERPYRYVGRGIFYFGLVFFGLGLISDAISPIRDQPQVLALFSTFSNPYAALLAGLFFTALVHSSGVATGLVVILAAGGVLTLEQSIPVLLGTNIGTTMTALLASMRLSPFARRAAVAHMIFNVLGAILLWPFIAPFSHLIFSLGGSSAQQVANAHTIFNVLAAILFLIFLTPFKYLVEKLIKIDEEEILLSTQYLSHQLPASKKQSFHLIEKELSHFFHNTYRLYERSIQFILEPSESGRNAIEKHEALADLLDERIEEALLELSRRPLSEAEAKKVVLLVRLSNVVEQLADTAKDLSSLRRSMSISAPSLSYESVASIEKIYEKMKTPFSLLLEKFPHDIADGDKLSRKLNSIQPAIMRGYNEHIKRLKSRKAHGGSLFVESSSYLEAGADKLKEILNLSRAYRRIR